MRRLTDLAKRVTEELIPKLESAGARFAAEELRQYDDTQLATAIQERLDSLRRWKETYRDEFIPFAHGVRCLAQYYNDAVRPVDPYEFVGLLKSEDMLASRRNRAMASLAARLRTNRQLKDALADALGALAAADATAWRQTLEPVLSLPHGSEFCQELDALITEFMDVTYGAERLLERPDLLLHTLLELAADTEHGAEISHAHPGLSRGELERCFFEAVGTARREEATEVLRIGRVSWRLRDDDNLLLSRVESQLLRAVDLGLDRLRGAGRLRGEPRRNQEAIPAIVAALRDDSHMPLEFPAGQPEDSQPHSPAQETPRQLIGQPASPGLASGKVRRITVADDIKGFRAGEVLVCDAIQPMMTHLVPLAAAIVERRGGMLIHGAIIARDGDSLRQRSRSRRRVAWQWRTRDRGRTFGNRHGRTTGVRSGNMTAYMPLGLGRHVCLGKALSTNILTTLLACILREFCVSLLPDQPDVEPVIGIVVSPRSDLRLSMRRLDTAGQRRESRAFSRGEIC